MRGEIEEKKRPLFSERTLVRAEIEVELSGVSDTNIHRGPGWNVPALTALLLLVRAEQSGVVTLLDHDECDPGLVVSLQLKLKR